MSLLPEVFNDPAHLNNERKINEQTQRKYIFEFYNLDKSSKG